MRLCVLSDIHGNAAALEAMLPLLHAESAEAHLFLGDLCGYYHDVPKALRILRRLDNLVAILGNHDRIFLDIFHGNESLRVAYRERYGLAMESMMGPEGKEVALWLSNLPVMTWLDCGIVVGVHGSPMDPMEGYVYPDTPLPVAPKGARFVCMGHTHYAMCRERAGVLFLNPGSVGQPRDGGWPSYAVLDTDTGSWALRRVPYDREVTKSLARAAGDTTPYLTEALERMETRQQT